MDDRSKPAETKDPRVEAAISDYLERVDRGEAVNREEFISRNGEIADALRSFFAAEEPLRKMAATKISDKAPESRHGRSPRRARRQFRRKRNPDALQAQPEAGSGAIRPLSDHPGSRQRGDGCGLPGPRHAAQTQCGDQNAAFRG